MRSNSSSAARMPPASPSDPSLSLNYTLPLMDFDWLDAPFDLKVIPPRENEESY